VVVEIYPRLFTGPVVKSRADARRGHLATYAPEVSGALRDDAIASEDAFDALFAVRAMCRHVDELAALPAIDDPVACLEGRVWQPRPPQIAEPNASPSRLTDAFTAGSSASPADGSARV
jgi:hypothetical protein